MLPEGRRIRFRQDCKTSKSAYYKFEHGECDINLTKEDANCSNSLHLMKTHGVHPQAVILQQRQTAHALI